MRILVEATRLGMRALPTVRTRQGHLKLLLLLLLLLLLQQGPHYYHLVRFVRRMGPRLGLCEHGRLVLLFEKARPSLHVDEPVSGVGFEVPLGRAGQGSVGVVGDGAHPRRRVARRGGKETERDLVLSCRLVDGQAEVVREVLLDRRRKGLDARQVSRDR